MVIVTIGNVITYVRIIKKELVHDGSERYQKNLRILCGLYVLGCSFRALLPRIDVERVCFFDTWLSCTVVGRSFATVAELSFMAQLTLVLHRVSSDIRKYAARYKHSTYMSLCSFICTLAKIAFGLNIVAQSFCWLGVTTTRQLWHVYEESIWAMTVLTMAICCAFLYSYQRYLPFGKQKDDQNLRQVRQFLGLFVVGGAIYVCYMFTVDIPMYTNRWKADELRGIPYLSFVDGLKDATSCKHVTRDFVAWREDLSWITGYFSVAVWVSIWLMKAPRLPNSSSETLKSD